MMINTVMNLRIGSRQMIIKMLVVIIASVQRRILTLHILITFLILYKCVIMTYKLYFARVALSMCKTKYTTYKRSKSRDHQKFGKQKD